MARSGSKREKTAAAPVVRRAVLRGNALATVDDSGRLKLPAGFRRAIEREWGVELYLTSLEGDSMWVYPLGVWQQREERLLGLPPAHPAVGKFLARTAFFGAEGEIDGQGRCLVPAVLRGPARLEGEVAVLGWLDHLEVWNAEVFRRRLEAEPLTADDRRALGEMGL